MKIEKDKVVTFHYQLSEVGKEKLESTDEGAPMAYLHGHGNLLSGLEEKMEGHAAGDQFSVELSPQQAFGEIKQGMEQRVPVKHLMGSQRWKKGMIATVSTEQGQRKVTIVKMGKFMATVDFNHPFAGKSLQFDVRIDSVREATAEEIAHGHAHGPGGHHH